jgi:hypothetical protein
MDRIAEMVAKKAMNYAQRNPDKLQAYGEKAMKFASNPMVQQKALSMGKKGLNFMQSNPQVQSKFLDSFNLAGMTRQNSVEQRLSRLEQQMASMTGMMQGGKTRKQRKQKKQKKQQKTRKH